MVEQQRAFLENRVRSLRALSRADIADQIGVHASTVSRATASKYAMLPSDEVIPYALLQA
jgi:RNA polymerase sigma-54 factor